MKPFFPLYLSFVYTGPLYPVAMFSAESSWGRVKGLARNRATPASTMLKSTADIVAAQEACLVAGIQDGYFNVSYSQPKGWAPENNVLDKSKADFTMMGLPKFHMLSINDQIKLQDMYLNISTLGFASHDSDLASYRELWSQYLDTLQASPSFNPRTKRFNTPAARIAGIVNFETFAREIEAQQSHLATRMDSGIQVHAMGVRINSITFKKGSWFLARPSFLQPNESDMMWFGHVIRVFSHNGPNGSNILLQVRNMILVLTFMHNTNINNKPYHFAFFLG